MRFWVEADAAELQRRLGQHLRDIALNDTREGHLLDSCNASLERPDARSMMPRAGSKDSTRRETSPQLAGDSARSVLTGVAYPQSLLATMLRRIHSDGEVAYARVAAIKGYLTRNSRSRGNPSEVSVKLNPAETNPGYNCGRLFALLEKAQIDFAGGRTLSLP